MLLLLLLTLSLVILLAGCGGIGSSRAVSASRSVSLLSLLPRNSPTDRRDVLAIDAGINAALAAHGNQSGGHRVVLIRGDSSDPSNGTESWQSCPDIGTRHAANPEIVGVVGPLTDGCAIGVIPAFARRGIAVVSPTATAPVFTHVAALVLSGGFCSVGQVNRLELYGCEPRDFYPRGVRNYAHVTATADRQGSVAAATFARLGVKRVYLLSPYGSDAWIAEPFRREARVLGLRIVGVGEPDVYRPTASAIRRQAHTVVASGADGLYLIGDAEADPAGRNAGLSPFLAAIRGVGFRGDVMGSFWMPNGLLVQRAPRAAEGMYYTSTRCLWLRCRLRRRRSLGG